MHPAHRGTRLRASPATTLLDSVSLLCWSNGKTLLRGNIGRQRVHLMIPPLAAKHSHHERNPTSPALSEVTSGLRGITHLMQAWRPPTSGRSAPRARDRRPAAPDRRSAARIWARCRSPSRARPWPWTTCSFRLRSAIRDTQLHAANILGEAGTIIDGRARTLRLGPSLRGTLGARALAPDHRTPRFLGLLHGPARTRTWI